MTIPKVIFFLDANMSDFHPLVLVLCAAYNKEIDLLGIVIEEGVVTNIQDGLLLTQQWCNLLQVGTNIDKVDKKYPMKINLYAGFNRLPYLEKRKFPLSLTKKIIYNLKVFYNIVLPNFDYNLNEFTGVIQTGAPSVDLLFNEVADFSDKTISVVTTVQVNSLAIGLDAYTHLSRKISSIFINGTNYLVPGNVPIEVYFEGGITLPSPFDDNSGEFNSMMNPSAYNSVIWSATQNDIDIQIFPLDCSNYTALNQDTINQLNKISEPYLQLYKDPWINNANRYYISMMESMLATDPKPQYLWDTCAVLAGLRAKCGQTYNAGVPFCQSSGKLNQYSFREFFPETSPTKIVKIFKFINYELCLTNSIRIIYNDPAYKL